MRSVHALATLLVISLSPLAGAPLHAEQTRAPAPATPVTLDDAIAEALMRSPALEPARESVALADIGRQRAAGEFALRVAPNWSSRTDGLGAGTQFGLAIERRLTTGTELRVTGDLLRDSALDPGAWAGGYAVTVVQPLLSSFGPVTTARLRDAERGVSASTRAFEQSRRDLVIRVAQAYFAVVRQQRLAEAAERALTRADKLREASEARTRVGLATKLDVLRADLLASQARAGLEGQYEALADHLDQLKVLLGRPFDADLTVDARAPFAAVGAPAAPAGIDALIASAAAGRLDLHEMRDRVADAKRAASVARWSLVPDVRLEATYDRRASGFGRGDSGLDSGRIDLPRRGWSVGLGTSYAFDRAGASVALAAADIQLRAAGRRLVDAERAVEADVRRAARAVDRAGARIAIQAQAVAVAEQQLALAEMRYERGLAGNFDVVDAESNLFQAESALISAQVERALAGLVLENASGTLDPRRYLQ